MAFSSIVHSLAQPLVEKRSPLTAELITKLHRQQELRLNGISRLATFQFTEKWFNIYLILLIDTNETFTFPNIKTNRITFTISNLSQ
ncbi:hypothetical protein VB711_13550 [Cronbergia sp. UHCC 0137]|uniref:hypothetical protein n=1 Tax=Cronbergia sp. UHCC 0137 TaxID=3110239 RepID=UPI002B1FD97C|nr:hypothetical protein [Cronbergia sp. UHCC 0137]MEA5618856.1 hypothetical protein [Cronbergia sp. UHCC 0137]